MMLSSVYRLIPLLMLLAGLGLPAVGQDYDTGWFPITTPITPAPRTFTYQRGGEFTVDVQLYADPDGPATNIIVRIDGVDRTFTGRHVISLSPGTHTIAFYWQGWDPGDQASARVEIRYPNISVMGPSLTADGGFRYGFRVGS